MKKYTNKKGLVLDLDYTLYDEYQYFAAVFDSFCKAEKLQKYSQLMKREFLRSRCANRDIFRDALQTCGFHTENNKYNDRLFQLYKSIDVTIPLYEDALEILEWCKKNKLKTGILTNGVVAAQQNKVRCLGVESLVDTIVYAREAGNGREKPDKRPFEVVAAKLKLPGTDLIFIGDNPLNDFAGAKVIGGHTVRLLRGVNKLQIDNAHIDDVIKDLREMKKWL